MDHSLNNLKCSECRKIIRPPFRICVATHVVCPHCKQHCGDDRSGYDSPECHGSEVEVTFLNSIFLDVDESCQYGCGFRGKVLDLQHHEDSCSNRPRLVNCRIRPCVQLVEEKDLIRHVEINHPDQIVDNCQENTQIIRISPKNPVIMLLQYESSYIFNEIYWLTLKNVKDDIFIDITHFLHVGPLVEHAQLLDAFDVYANQSRIISNKLKITKLTDDTTFSMTNKGENIGEILYGIRTHTANTTARPESVLFELECYVCCGKMQSPIRMCLRGHSLCQGCAQRVTECPTCKDPITKARNYALEFIAIKLESQFRNSFSHSDFLGSMIKCSFCKMVMEPPIKTCSQGHSLCASCVRSNTHCATCLKLITATRNFSLEGLIAKLILPCRHAAFGCLSRIAQDNSESHVRKCFFRPMSCTASCKWKGPYCHIKEHWQEKHKSLMKNGVSYNVRISDNNLFSRAYLYEAFGEFFVVTSNNFKEYTFFACQLSSDATSLYYYTISFVNETTGYHISFSLPCGCVSNVGDAYSETFKVQNVCGIPKELVHNMLKDKDQLKFKLTIHKK